MRILQRYRGEPAASCDLQCKLYHDKLVGPKYRKMVPGSSVTSHKVARYRDATEVNEVVCTIFLYCSLYHPTESYQSTPCYTWFWCEHMCTHAHFNVSVHMGKHIGLKWNRHALTSMNVYQLSKIVATLLAKKSISNRSKWPRRPMIRWGRPWSVFDGCRLDDLQLGNSNRWDHRKLLAKPQISSSHVGRWKAWFPIRSCISNTIPNNRGSQSCLAVPQLTEPKQTPLVHGKVETDVMVFF